MTGRCSAPRGERDEPVDRHPSRFAERRVRKQNHVMMTTPSASCAPTGPAAGLQRLPDARHFGADYEASGRASEPPNRLRRHQEAAGERIIEHYAPAREMYKELMADPARLRAILDEAPNGYVRSPRRPWPRSANGWASLVARQGWREGRCTTCPVLPDAIPCHVQQLGTDALSSSPTAPGVHLDVSPCRGPRDDDRPAFYRRFPHTAPASLADRPDHPGDGGGRLRRDQRRRQLVAYFNDVIMIFFLAWLLAFILSPLASALVHLVPRLPRALAVILVYALLIVLLVGNFLVAQQSTRRSTA